MLRNSDLLKSTQLSLAKSSLNEFKKECFLYLRVASYRQYYFRVASYRQHYFFHFYNDFCNMLIITKEFNSQLIYSLVVKFLPN